MYLILTSKPGQFRTETGDGVLPVETWDYEFCGRRLARFVIATAADVLKIRVIDEGDARVVNLVPRKFFPHFETLEKARLELRQLVGGARFDSRLVRVEAP
jgi:hypothetical protein